MLLMLLVTAAAAGCVGDGPPAQDDGGEGTPLLLAGPDERAFDDTQAREFELVVDPADRSHVTLGYVIPGEGDVPQSWLSIAVSDDGGDTWTVQKFCGDPHTPGDTTDPACPFLGGVLTSDPVLLRLHDGTILYVGVVLRADSVEQFAARFEPGALEPTSVHVVSRSAWNFVESAHMLPAPYRVYYNGKANVMQERHTDTLHLVWAANLIVDARVHPTSGLPFWTTSEDGGRTWSTPMGLSNHTFADTADPIYAVGVQAFETLDGNLHAIWWESQSNALYQVTSTDGGQTFSPPREIAPAVARPPGAPIDSDNLTRPWVVVDESDGPWRGSVYLLYDDLSGGDRDLYLLVSRDGAATWSDPQRLATVPEGDGRDDTMARLHIDEDGAVLILYPRWKHLERWSPYEMRLAHSVDGGQTFSDVKLSSDFSPIHNPGDYNDLERTEDGILAIWEDGRGADGEGRWAFQSLVRTE